MHVAGHGLRQRADGRHRRRARPVRHHGRRRRQLRLPRDPAVRRRSCARATSWCRAAGCPSGGGTRPARGDAAARTAGGATRCSRCWRAAGSRARSTTSTAACAASRKTLYDRLDQRCTGMEFATEMIIKAEPRRRARSPRCRSRCTPTAAQAHAPHLKTFRDGWRTLRFFLMYSPRWLFLVPGVAADRCSGLIGYALALPGVTIRGRHASTRTRCCSPAWRSCCGYQSIAVRALRQDVRDQRGLCCPRTAADALLRDRQPRARPDRRRRRRSCSASRCCWSARSTSGGCTTSARSTTRTRCGGSFPGRTLTALGFQTMLSSFFISLWASGAGDVPRASGTSAVRGVASAEDGPRGAAAQRVEPGPAGPCGGRRGSPRPKRRESSAPRFRAERRFD